MGGTVRSLTIALAVDGTGVEPGLKTGQDAVARHIQEMSTANKAALSKAAADVRAYQKEIDAYTQSKGANVPALNQMEAKQARLKYAEVMAAHTAAVEINGRIDAQAASKLASEKQAIEDRYFNATRTQRDVQLRDLGRYYAQQRQLHAGNAGMLATIDKAQAAEQAAIMGGDRGLSGRERRMVMAQVLGGALGGTAGEMGNAAGLGMMVGGVTGGAVAGVLMLTAVIRQMGEESKHTAEIRKAASADTVEAAEWWRKDVQPQTSTIGQKHRDEAVAWGAKASAAQAAWREMAGEHPLNPGAWIEGLHSLEGQFNFAKREQRRHGAYDKADQRTFDRRQAEDRAASVRKTQLEAAGEGDDAQRGRLEEAQAVERTALERRQRDRQEEIDRKLKEDLATARAPRKGRKQRNTDFLVEKAESDYEAATKLARRETIDENSQQSGREPQERARLEREIADSKAARETEANQAEIRVSSEGFEQRRLLMEEQHRAEMATYERHGLDKKDLIRKQGAETAVLLQDEWKHQAEEAARARELFEELAKQRALAGAGLDAHSQHVAALAIERREFEKKIEKETEHTRSKSKAYLIKALNDFDDTHKAIDEHAARLEGQRITEENHPLIQFQKYKEELDRIKGVKGALGESDYIRALTGKAKSLIGDSGVGNFEDWAQRHNILQSGSMSTNEMTKKILDELQELKKIMAQLLADGFKLKAS